jgi:endonuclease YncB( thermonuclease family)
LARIIGGMIRLSLLVLLGIASFATVYVALGPREPQPVAVAEPEAVVEADAAPAQTAAIDEPSGSDDAAPVTFELRPGPGRTEAIAEVRNVTPPDMMSGPLVSGPLTRVEQPAPESQERTQRLFNPIVVAADIIRVRGRDIHLAGVDAPDFDARCGEGEAAWPCGRMARAALRRFIRRRAIECEVPAGAAEVPDPAICRVGGDDIAAWLVAQGWAKPDGDRYGDERDAAREAQLGLWGDGRPGDQAEIAASR